MTSDFARTLALLRREKKISQRTAAGGNSYRIRNLLQKLFLNCITPRRICQSSFAFLTNTLFKMGTASPRENEKGRNKRQEGSSSLINLSYPQNFINEFQRPNLRYTASVELHLCC